MIFLWLFVYLIDFCGLCCCLLSVLMYSILSSRHYIFSVCTYAKRQCNQMVNPVSVVQNLISCRCYILHENLHKTTVLAVNINFECQHVASLNPFCHIVSLDCCCFFCKVMLLQPLLFCFHYPIYHPEMQNVSSLVKQRNEQQLTLPTKVVVIIAIIIVQQNTFSMLQKKKCSYKQIWLINDS